MRWLATLFAALFLAACGPTPEPPPGPPRPALWEVTGADGARGWLFGTVHVLPRGFDWRTRRLDQALAASGVLVLEIADIDDKAAIGAAFASLARSPGLPPLSARIAAERRPALVRLLDRADMAERDFASVETWAAALMLAQAAGEEDRGAGVESGLARLAPAKPVIELEGVRAQLGLFDRLAEADQRDLLDAVLADAGTAEADSRRMAGVWRAGDMAAIAVETNEGLLADPELRQVLLVGRNRAWAGRIEALLRGGRRPFVAVGAAHLAGPDGLPALLAARGWTVRRIQ